MAPLSCILSEEGAGGWAGREMAPPSRVSSKGRAGGWVGRKMAPPSMHDVTVTSCVTHHNRCGLQYSTTWLEHSF